MRIVAVGAILGDRRMLPKIGAAIFGMAVVAGVVRGGSCEEPVGCATMGVVAAVAGHLAMANGVRVRLHGLGSLLLVAVETDLGLRCGTEHRIPLDVAVVAIGTGNCVVVVRTAVPRETDIRQVTIHTLGVLLGDRRS